MGRSDIGGSLKDLRQTFKEKGVIAEFGMPLVGASCVDEMKKSYVHTPESTETKSKSFGIVANVHEHARRGGAGKERVTFVEVADN